MSKLDDLLRNIPVKTISGFNNAAYDPRTETIYVGPRFRENKTILAHEVGHKLTANPVTRLAPILGRRGEWIPTVGTLLALGVGQMYPEYRQEAALTNMGVQFAAILPQLYSEYMASQKAREIYPNIDENQLNSMYNTYLGNAALRLGIPASVHLLHEALMAGKE